MWLLAAATESGMHANSALARVDINPTAPKPTGPSDEGLAGATETMKGLPKKLAKQRLKQPGYTLSKSGLQVKDAEEGRADTKEVQAGDVVVVSWEGYTINYFGRPIETRTLNKAFNVEQEPYRFKVGDGTTLAGIDEGVRGMREGGVRQLYIPVELGYDAGKKLGPRPSTASGTRALDFVMDNTGLMDKTLLINVAVKRVYQR